MGTHCYIALEESDGSVEYIFVTFDGYFSNIVPLLREYTNYDDVKKMIARGNDSVILLSEVQKNEPYTVTPENRPGRASSMYTLFDLYPRGLYFYVFTRDNEWLCSQTSPFFQMSELKYFYKSMIPITNKSI